LIGTSRSLVGLKLEWQGKVDGICDRLQELLCSIKFIYVIPDDVKITDILHTLQMSKCACHIYCIHTAAGTAGPVDGNIAKGRLAFGSRNPTLRRVSVPATNSRTVP
jgi:hypothetical protein